ncbi:cytochrome c family protein [Aurantimonas sp. VKM B-3413]|uniref:c-type cytochrome n=1 Tax=Aurantimonas sp. VKM B-3413 TaxID=2779401 RepID=UPI00351DA18E
MNSFEANKIFGAVLGTVFVLFGGSLLAEGLFHSEAPEKPGFEIAAAEEGSQEGGAEASATQEDPPVAALLQTADVDAGASQFKKCQACHSGEKGGPNKVGPHLWDIVDRPIASVSDFNYSAAMKDFSEGGSKNWTYDHLYHFIKNPKGYIPGTAMGFAGLKDPEARANVIAYLRSLSDNPAPLPPAPAEGEASADETASGEAAPTVTQPGTTTQPGEGTDKSQVQTPATTDTQAAAARPNAEATPTMGDQEQPNPPAAEQPQGESPAAAPQETGAAEQTALAGDPEAGKSVFRKCQACHAVGEGAKNKIGPELNGIVGEKIAAVDGYSFSSALKDYASSHPAWTVDELHQWLAGPQKLVPGTKMSFPGLSKPEDIDNVIAYLATFGENGTQKSQ